MFTDIIPPASALLLTVFSLFFSLSRRRELYFPLPGRTKKPASNRHAWFLLMLALLAAATCVYAAGTVFGFTAGKEAAARALRIACMAIHAIFLISFAVYAVLTGRDSSGSERAAATCA